MHLIIPAAGQSTRFPNMRPKWMLTHPSGSMMLTEAIRGLNLHEMDAIHLGVLQEHITQYQCMDGIYRQFEQLGVRDKLIVTALEKPTRNQAETIAEIIRRNDIQGAFFCKDSDNYFAHAIAPGNAVCTYDLAQIKHVNASNKSYVQFGEQRIITKIIEKTVISSHFCVGGYGFASAEAYLHAYNGIASSADIYVSDVIFQMLLKKQLFEAQAVTHYLDWGTLDDWNQYKSQFAVLFVDIDGTLVENSGEHFPPFWGTTAPLQENVATMNALYESGKIQIILTTSRSEEFAEATIAQLERWGIKYHRIIYGLFHAKRIVINDYADSNPYPSCSAINIHRNSNELTSKLRAILSE